MAANTQRTLGTLTVSQQGFGCMGLSHTYGQADEAESLKTLDRAMALGITFFDTADIYGNGHNEGLVAKAIDGRRDRLVVATKFGNRLDRETSGRTLDASPAYIRQAVEASLTRLKTDRIDLYYMHRLDPQTPIEDTVGEMARLKAEGKILALGLSEVDSDILRRAQAVAPIAALQSEYSLWTRDVEEDILATCAELGVGFVAYSPLGRGFLANSEIVEANDRRLQHPRFQADAIAANSLRRAAIEAVAASRGVTTAQVSLAWVLSKGVVPIPGTRHVSHLESNWAANDIILTPDETATLEAAFPIGSTVGARYPAGSPPVPSAKRI
ncbi:aldo/keto reductase [Phenylobacterium immobile]|uniref:aldo/keto reductase n=1 Tax=Phenylobacterium immobile TaxID=21 RepID=UPI000AC226EA|nr:aldo/keto reductase [Phenylobacterium immobile]